jgi:hypothetical protein
MPAFVGSRRALLSRKRRVIDRAELLVTLDPVTGTARDPRGRYSVVDPGGSATPTPLPPIEGKPYLFLPGVAGNYASIATGNAYRAKVAGTISVRTRFYHPTWRPAAQVSILGANVARLLLRLSTSGAITVGMYDSTGTLRSAASTTVVPGAAATTWIRGDYDFATDTVRVYTAPDTADETTAAWAQLGDPIVLGLVGGSVDAAFEPLVVGQSNTSGSGPTDGICFRAHWYNDGASYAHIDFTNTYRYNATLTSLVAETGQTVTINRSATGKKAAVPVRSINGVLVPAPILVFGDNDYLEVADAAGLNVGALDSLAVVAVVRQFAAPSTNVSVLSKIDALAATSVGYSLYLRSAGNHGFYIADGAAFTAAATTGALTLGATATIAGWRDTAADAINSALNGAAGTAQTDTTTLTLSNTDVLRVGRLAGAGTAYADMELMGLALFRQAITAAEAQVAGHELLVS